MANLCSFTMKVVGKNDESIRKFYDALVQNGNEWMGRGAEADVKYDNDDHVAYIDGWCKWSVNAALILNAQSMQKQKETKKGNWFVDDEFYKRDYISLFEACEKYDVKMEVFSVEPGCEFAEHYLYDSGVIIDETTSYNEYFLSEYETKEEAEKEYGILITDDEWEEEGYICRGGFVEDFEI